MGSTPNLEFVLMTGVAGVPGGFIFSLLFSALERFLLNLLAPTLAPGRSPPRNVRFRFTRFLSNLLLGDIQ